MKTSWFVIVMCCMLLLSGCRQESPPVTESLMEATLAPTTEPTVEPTTAPTVELTTEPTTEKEKTLADLDLSRTSRYGGACIGYYPFIYEQGKENKRLAIAVNEDWETVEEWIKGFRHRFVYAWEESTEKFICVIDEPVLAKESTNYHIFAITEKNTVIVSDMTGSLKLELYQATEPLGLQSLGYCRKTLYFIEGSSIMNLDLVTGEVRKLIEYKGAIDADPLYGIEDEFPHLLCIKTETDDVACNLETGETAIIPETGQWGTAAFESYMEFGTWPETDK